MADGMVMVAAAYLVDWSATVQAVWWVYRVAFLTVAEREYV
jgi:hypothetical protein